MVDGPGVAFAKTFAVALGLLNTGAVWLAIAYLFVQTADARTDRYYLDEVSTRLCEVTRRSFLATIAGDTGEKAEAVRVAIAAWKCPPINPPDESIAGSLSIAP